MIPQACGKWIVLAGLLIIIAAVVFSILGKLPLIGRLPGDLVIRREHTTLYLPITSCLLLSITLTMLIRSFKS